MRHLSPILAAAIIAAAPPPASAADADMSLVGDLLTLETCDTLLSLFAEENAVTATDQRKRLAMISLLAGYAVHQADNGQNWGDSFMATFQLIALNCIAAPNSTGLAQLLNTSD